MLTLVAEWVRLSSVQVFDAAIRDGQTFATAGSDKTVRLWQVSNGNLLGTFEGHKQSVTACDLSDNFVLSGCEDGSALLFSRSTLKPVTLLGHTDSVAGVRLSVDESLAISVSLDGTGFIHSTQGGDHLATLTGHTDSVLMCSLSSDGSRIVTCSADHKVLVWDTHTAKPLVSFHQHTRKVSGCDFNSDGSQIATCSSDKTLRVFDARCGLASTMNCPSVMRCCVFTPDGKHILTGCDDRTLRMWSPSSLSVVETFPGKGSIWRCNVANDGETVVACAPDATVTAVWNLKSGHLLQAITGHVGRSDQLPAMQKQRRDLLHVAAWLRESGLGVYAPAICRLGFTFDRLFDALDKSRLHCVFEDIDLTLPAHKQIFFVSLNQQYLGQDAEPWLRTLDWRHALAQRRFVPATTSCWNCRGRGDENAHHNPKSRWWKPKANKHAQEERREVVQDMDGLVRLFRQEHMCTFEALFAAHSDGRLQAVLGSAGLGREAKEWVRGTVESKRLRMMKTAKN